MELELAALRDAQMGYEQQQPHAQRAWDVSAGRTYMIASGKHGQGPELAAELILNAGGFL